ncbi:3-deoxy-manno-octulosonate cytidylyltransferase [Helicobacter aurati]|uniref:3-deoxy-manno-octulosonate cytidylyltransferase n=1 Tax=Helicobacter aurati TaxID=137778 RepID=A0A3D8J356_9HELI|nr:3-deoxy-manno-octulosonate cytidylyltransferase [Helicobacter aurati]RDU71957.1 3-deoxy-manno-octulosonate cytidylyltransferase [Helicobacter aurati]
MIIIPARLASTRFPRKILCDIDGLPMFVRSALNARQVDDVVVAVDSQEAYDIAQRFGIKAVITSQEIANGTLRVLAASRLLGLKDDEIIINLQADEPFLETHVIETLQKSMQQAQFMGTCAKYIDSVTANNSNIVKVILNHKSEAIYFSRSSIPFCRDSQDSAPKQFLGHIGIYGYFKSSLECYASLCECALEDTEKLEQLRAIYYRKPILVSIVESQSIGVDTPEDLYALKQRFAL